MTVEQYFNPSENLPHRLRAFSENVAGERFLFVSDSGTFSRDRLDFGTRLLVEAALKLEDFPIGGKVLDLGCGWGPAGTILLKFFPECRLSFSDINERALTLVKKNLEANVPGGKAAYYLSDGLEKIDGKFDLILLNPPIRAGKSVVYRLFAEAKEALADSGRFLTVVSRKQGADSAKAELERLYGAGKVSDIARKAGFHVYVMRKAEAGL